MSKPTIDVLCGLAITNKIYPNRKSIDYHFLDVFENIDVKKKKVLDIGGGIGLLSFYSAINGAEKVVCLEPESEGSASGMIENFTRFKNQIDPNLPVQHLPKTLQEYLAKSNEKFDVVILHNSINHLDEEACITLRENEDSNKAYLDMFKLLFDNMNPGGKLIISDCSRSNFFNSLGMQSPFIRSIEWHKHQHPNTWIKLLEKVGFTKPSLNWSSPNRLGDIGRTLLKNSFCAYFTSSHFRLAMERK